MTTSESSQALTEVEENLIAAVFGKPSIIEELGFNPRDFRQPRHEDIWHAMSALQGARKPVDPVSVHDELNRRADGPQPLTLADLHQLNNGAVLPTSGYYYADIVRREAQRRRILEAGQQMVLQAQTGDPEKVLEQASATLEGLQESIHSQGVVFIGDDFDAVAASLKEKPKYIPTPWPSLNDRLGGFLPGAMYVVGARPAAGKSIWGLQSAISLAEHGSVAYISLEMSRYDILKRAISNVGRIDGQHLNHHELTSRDWQQLEEIRPKLKSLPIGILDQDVSITQMRRYVRAVHRRKPLAGIVLDYLGLLNPPQGDRRNKHEYISAMSRELKLLAMKLNVPVIVLAQLNRESERREGGVPKISDLRDSGSVEQDADAIVILHRDENNPWEVQMIVGKNRRGSTGSVTFNLEGYYSRITEQGAAA